MLRQPDDALRKGGRENQGGRCREMRKKVAAPKIEYACEDDSLG